MEDIQSKVKAFLFAEICDQEETGPISNDTPLITSGIVDSVSTLQLVEFIEANFGIEFKPHEVEHDNLNTLDRIATFITNKAA